jgi:hypothetical protein
VYTVTRFPDTTADGECTRMEVATPPVTLETSTGGAGATHFSLERGLPFLSGISFDVYFQLAGSHGTLLRSECVTVTVK